MEREKRRPLRPTDTNSLLERPKENDAVGNDIVTKLTTTQGALPTKAEKLSRVYLA